MISRGGTGKVGEHLVIAELLQRGFKPFVPVVDDHGVDIMLPNGNRIQVKAANLSVIWQTRKEGGKAFPTSKRGYQFNLQRTVFGTKEKLQTVGITYTRRDISVEADFLVLVGIDQHKFWVVPTAEIKGCSHILIDADSARKVNNKNGPHFKFWRAVRAGENNWEVLHHSRIDSRDEGTGISESREILQ
jgi:hypothetical protein